MRRHHYETDVVWTGDQGTGTAGYRSYGRDHTVSAPGPAPIAGSSDPAFRGDPTGWNPEQLLVASVAQCHMLWYLHLSVAAGVVVVGYEDHATAVMEEHDDGSGEITEVTLHPRVRVLEPSMVAIADELHGEVHRYCFIARSVRFPIHHQPTTVAGR